MAASLFVGGLLAALILLLIYISVDCTIPLATTREGTGRSVFGTLGGVTIGISRCSSRHVDFAIGNAEFFMRMIPRGGSPLCLILSLNVGLSSGCRLVVVPFTTQATTRGVPIFFSGNRSCIVFSYRVCTRSTGPFVTILPSVVHTLRGTCSGFRRTCRCCRKTASDVVSNLADSSSSSSSSSDDDTDLVSVVLGNDNDRSAAKDISSATGTGRFVCPCITGANSSGRLCLAGIAHATASAVLSVASCGNKLCRSYCVGGSDCVVIGNGGCAVAHARKVSAGQ